MARLLAPEDTQSLIEVMTVRWAKYLGKDHFEVSGRAEPGFVELSVALVRDDRTFRYDIEIRVQAGARDKVTPEQGRDLAIDFLGYYLDLYFTGGRDLLLPLDFQPYQFGEYTVWARGDVRNPMLDEMADQIIEAGVPLAPDDPRHKLR